MPVTESLILELNAKLDEYNKDIKQAQANTDKFQKNTADGFTNVERKTESATAANKKFSLSMAAVGVSIGIAARAISEAADQYTLIERQIKRNETTQEGFNEKLTQLTDISMDLGASLSSVTNLYARLQFATESLGLREDQVLQITETLNKAFKTTGSTAEEAASATLQLSQAFASGVLQGDEFRAVSESAPALMKALAKELNVTTGELKKMSSEGKITADVLSKSILNSTQEVNKEYERVIGNTKTMSESMSNLWTGFTLLAGSLDEATGATDGLGWAIDGTGQKMVELSKAIKDNNNEITSWMKGGLIKVFLDTQDESSKTASVINDSFGYIGDVVSASAGYVADPISDITDGIFGIGSKADVSKEQLKELTDQLIAIGAIAPVSLFEQPDIVIPNKEGIETPLPGVTAAPKESDEDLTGFLQMSQAFADQEMDAMVANFDKKKEIRFTALQEQMQMSQAFAEQEMDLLFESIEQKEKIQSDADARELMAKKNKAKQEEAIEKAKNAAIQSLTLSSGANLLGAISSVSKKGSAIQKAAAKLSIVASTAAGIQRQFADFPFPIAAANSIAIGLSGIAAMRSLDSGQVATGGASAGGGSVADTSQQEEVAQPSISTNVTDISTGTTSNVIITLQDGTDLATGLLESQEAAENDGRGDLF